MSLSGAPNQPSSPLLFAERRRRQPNLSPHASPRLSPVWQSRSCRSSGTGFSSDEEKSTVDDLCADFKADEEKLQMLLNAEVTEVDVLRQGAIDFAEAVSSKVTALANKWVDAQDSVLDAQVPQSARNAW